MGMAQHKGVKMVKKFSSILLLVMVVILLVGCVPKPTPTVAPTLTPKPYERLIMKDCITCSAPVVPEIDWQKEEIGRLKPGDMAPIRERVMQGDQLWLEVLVGDLRQFDPGMVGWVKYKDYKMLTEWVQP